MLSCLVIVRFQSRLPAAALAKEGALRTMRPRRAVPLTPLKSRGLTRLLSCKQIASVSPFFAALTNRSQIAENTATLSLLASTLTGFAPLSPAFATHTKTTGGGGVSFPFWFTQSGLCEGSSRFIHTALPSESCFTSYSFTSLLLYFPHPVSALARE
jgi:hypothetical protein